MDKFSPLRTGVTIGSTLAIAGAVHAFYNAKHLRRLTPDGAPGGAEQVGAPNETVTVMIPARDEASNISDCLATVQRQQGVTDLQILVGDDNSSDETAMLVQQVADTDVRVTLVPIAEPGPGWLGKPNACAQLASLASGSVLVFIDADVRLHPQALALAVTELRSGLDLVSCWPKQLHRSALGWLVQPLQQWSWLTTLPLRMAEHNSRPSLTAANGQFLVFDADGYRRAGGHEQVRNNVLDDIGLARASKSASQRVGVADASAVAACAMYDSDRQVIAGYSKSLWTAFGGPVGGLVVGAGLLITYVAPVMYALCGNNPKLRTFAFSGYVAGVGGRVVSAKNTGSQPWPDSLCQPVSVTAVVALIAHSVVQHFRGALTWRGRSLSLAAQ